MLEAEIRLRIIEALLAQGCEIENLLPSARGIEAFVSGRVPPAPKGRTTHRGRQ